MLGQSRCPTLRFGTRRCLAELQLHWSLSEAGSLRAGLREVRGHFPLQC